MNRLHPLASPDRRVIVKFTRPLVAGGSGLIQAPTHPEMSHLPDLSERADDSSHPQPAFGTLDVEELAELAPQYPIHAARSDWSAVRG